MDNIGAQGFRWFIARVEDVKDPEKNGRVRIRVISLHSENKGQLPKDNLPWARVLMPVTSPSLNGVGTSPTGIDVDSTVVGFFLDGNECNYPVVMGTLYGTDRPDETVGIEKTSRNDRKLPGEPGPAVENTPLDVIYPNNKVIKTKSGHIMEVDDTPNFERINLYHKSGTYIEINNEGRLVIKAVGDVIDLTAKNKTEYIKGDYNLSINGNMTVRVTGRIILDGDSASICGGTEKAARIGDSVDVGIGKIISGSSKVTIG